MVALTRAVRCLTAVPTLRRLANCVSVECFKTKRGDVGSDGKRGLETGRPCTGANRVAPKVPATLERGRALVRLSAGAHEVSI